jgi:cytochrome P450
MNKSTSFPPGPQDVYPILGQLTRFWGDKLAFLQQMQRTYGDIAHYTILGNHFYQLNHPDLIQEVLVNQAAQLRKSDLDHQIFKQVLGNGLLGNEGESHRQQRKLMQPAFHSKRIEAYGRIMTDYTARHIAQWQDGATVDAHEAMTTITMRIVAKTLYDADVTDSNTEIAEAIHGLNAISNHQYMQGFVVPSWIPVPQNQKVKQHGARLNALLMPIIEARRQSGEDKGDLLSMLLAAQDEETGAGMSDQQVRDEVVTLFIAGHETTSNLMAWVFYFLARHPEVEAALHVELDTVLHGRTPTLHDALPYADLIIKETLRLRPPAWILSSRVSEADIQVGGYTLAKGSLIFVSPWVMHHHADYYAEPERFWPERWQDGQEKQLPRYAYLPFGGGPRVCIGNSFALMEARLMLATIAQQYRLRLSAGQVVVPEALVTLRPQGGLPMVVEERIRQVPFRADEVAVPV